MRFRSGLGLLALALLAFAVYHWKGQDALTPFGVGARAPDFSFPTLSGDTVALGDLRGKVVLVNVWATWCPPCVRELPSMQRLYEMMEGEEFEILAVNTDAPQGERGPNGMPGGDVEAYVARLGLTFPILLDPASEIWDSYEVTGLPESFVIDKEGVIFKKIVAYSEWDRPEHVDLVRRLLRE